MIHIIIGIILLAITIYVHKHTYGKWTKERVKFPLWLLIVMILVSAIPYLNIVMFTGGLITYFICIGEDITFRMPKSLKSIVDILNREI